MIPRFRSFGVDAAIIGALFVVSFLTSQAAMRGFRAAGGHPQFYQSNFEPAVMLACGRGFVVSASTPPALIEFLNVTRDTFDCASLPPAMAQTQLTSPANANWYYLYGAAAAVWKISGVSWTALDALGSLLSAFVAVISYGLFRLVAGRAVALLFAALLMLSPANLSHLMSLRDYSKAPFVLAGILILAALVIRPMGRAAALALAAIYGAVIAIGYGFRGDLAVMVPFGALVVVLFQHGQFRANLVRNVLSATVLLAAFAVVAWPVISGLSLGGCQYHFSLLGLTDPLTNELRVTPSLYSFGPHLLDTFADLKTGDYASRVLNAQVPRLCTAEYDTASGQLYFEMARTFPADFVVRAYASVLMILRVGLAIPVAMFPAAPFESSQVMSAFYRTLSAVSSPLAPLGVLLTFAAIAGVCAYSVRLGLALAFFVLFLAGYPSIRFDERHWFHLRIIPWFTVALVATQVVHLGTRVLDRSRLLRMGVAATVFVGSLALALGVVRMVQTPRVGELISQYSAAATERLTLAPKDASSLKVDWPARDYGVAPAHRGSDLVVVTLDSGACAGTEPLGLRVQYDADVVSHDLSATIAVQRPAPGAAPTRVFVPVFWQGVEDHTELKFSGLQVTGAPASCVSEVARVADRGAVPLWLEMQVPANWPSQPLYESMRPPRLVNR